MKRVYPGTAWQLWMIREDVDVDNVKYKTLYYNTSSGVIETEEPGELRGRPNYLPNERLPEGWSIKTSPDGDTYYINPRTNLPQWEFPIGIGIGYSWGR